ncbi:hypothetical protein ACH49_13445 [Streptomyces leeuwenhoekii]|uniref:Secreted Protein n=1 Tax=Streptomyces leeuwenhoekii TaxID=1437453 RepID=A0ABR5HZ60_STRLW|nr:hypothetical protein [Streptomyces leeuwenhoekii]KMS79061.1 hypothetical protein ACH49_13445 [Streptomyces leeuwenhoekii]
MDLTGGARATAIAAAATMLGGLSVLLHGIVHSNTAHAIGGGGLTIVALMTVSMLLLRRWIVDTRTERQALADAQRQAEAERARYFAAQAALENEHARLARDMARERASISATLMKEREAMRAEFEDERATLVCETMEATVLMFHGGRFAPETPKQSNLIRFPKELPAQTPAADRSREHGVVGP